MDALAEVKNRLNIGDVVGQYVQLKRAGQNFKGLSPFTSEKTASFIVSPQKQIWHDFSSGKGGDMFTFVQEVEGLDFKGSLELLARQAGVDLEQFRGQGNQTGSRFKSRALEALELAAKFYQRQLLANKTALEYLMKQRKFSRETLLAWRLGYSPNTGHALADFLTKHGFERDEMKRAGIVVERYSRLVDMFRGRIMIPLCDSRGTVVGFTARLLADEPDSPKYINTPQSITYNKSRNVFGLHQAKEAIRKTGCVVAVEGQMDVIASYQAKVTNVVASAGTAMTESHLRELKRFTGDIRLCFDADRAGLAATERMIPLAQKTEVNLKIVTIIGAKDPDELVQKDPAAWQKAVDAAVYAPDWLMEHYQKELDLNSAQGKINFTDILLATVRRLRDPVEQEHYLKKIAKLTQTSLEAVQAKLAGKTEPAKFQRKIKTQPAAPDRQIVEYQRLQDHLLAMALVQPKLRELLNDCHPEFFTEGLQRDFFKFLKTHSGSNIKIKTMAQNLRDYVKILSLQFEEIYSDLPPDDLAEQAVKLKRRLIDRYVKMQNRKIISAMQIAKDETGRQALMRKADKLNELIR